MEHAERPLRVGIFHGDMPTQGKKPGGSSVYVARLAEDLATAGHNVEVFTLRPGSEIPGVRQSTVPFAWLGRWRVGRCYVWPVVLNAMSFVDKDVLHLFGDDAWFFRRDVATVRTFLGSALFESVTATTRRRKLDQAVLFLMERISARAADAHYGIGPDSVMLSKADGLLPTSVRPPELDPPTRRSKAVLFIGTWSGRKRGSLLFETFVNEIRPRTPDAELWMVSDVCDEGPGVTWFQAPSDDALAELMSRAAVFCLPSTYEGLGLPYLEALVAGTPIVATANFGALYVLQGTRSSIVEDHQLGAAIMRALEQSPEQRAAETAPGRSRAAEFTADRVVRLHEQAYAQAMIRFADGRRPRSTTQP